MLISVGRIHSIKGGMKEVLLITTNKDFSGLSRPPRIGLLKPPEFVLFQP